jgi:hypothetical protein
MSYATTASLVIDAVQTAQELAAPAIEAFGQTVAYRDAV